MHVQASRRSDTDDDDQDDDGDSQKQQSGDRKIAATTAPYRHDWRNDVRLVSFDIFV